MENKFNTLYRVQSTESSKISGIYRNTPIKRVLISSCGKIEFNPDEKKYIYFSKTNKHHVYYIFNKVFKIVVEELNKQNHTNIYKSMNLPDRIYEYQFYRSVNLNIIKKVQDFFKNFLPPMNVETVSIKYLNTMKSFLDKCTITNSHKTITNSPERSDTKTFGGAYGINDAWLTLLKCCTKETTTSKISIDSFFTFLLENTHRTSCLRYTLKEALTRNPNFFNILNCSTIKTLPNPEITNKNNSNKIVSALDEIYKKSLYSPNVFLEKSDFDKVKKELKHNIEELRLEM